MSDVKQFCISCSQEGHTYVECPQQPFWPMVAGILGVVDIPGCGRGICVLHGDHAGPCSL